MDMINRRNILKGTGAVVASPLMGLLYRSESPAQSVSPLPASSNPFIPCSKDLIDFASEGLYQMYTNYSQGIASAEDLKHGSEMLHLLGDHITNTGTDYLVRLYAKGQALTNT
jgi:hypothetical protein